MLCVYTPIYPCTVLLTGGIRRQSDKRACKSRPIFLSLQKHVGLHRSWWYPQMLSRGPINVLLFSFRTYETLYMHGDNYSVYAIYSVFFHSGKMSRKYVIPLKGVLYNIRIYKVIISICWVMNCFTQMINIDAAFREMMNMCTSGMAGLSTLFSYSVPCSV